MINNSFIKSIYSSYCQVKQLKSHKKIVDAVYFMNKFISQNNFEQIYISFNGGKDATVVLFLVCLALCQGQFHYDRISCLSFKQPQPFKEIQNFISYLEEKLNLQIYQRNSKKYQQQLIEFMKDHSLKYIVMGSRKTDPGCSELAILADSDQQKGYPYFKRINPIIYWNCQDVWKFILDLKIPYCSLYNQGYTSIGNMDNTIPNQSLYDPNTKKFQQAYKAEGQVQRINRNKSIQNP